MAIACILLSMFLNCGIPIEDTAGHETSNRVADQRTIVVEPGEFKVEKIEARFRSILANNPPETKVLKVEVFPSEAAVTDNCKCSTDVTYEFWLRMFNQLRHSQTPVAELLLIDNNAA